MASISLFSLLFILGILISLPRNASDVSEQTDLQTYIVHLRAPDHQNFSDRESWYTSLLSASKANANKKSRIIHFYHHVFPGFAAKLTPEELESLKKTKGFVSAWPEEFNFLHTTHSPAFLGLQPNVGFWRDSNYGEGMIIGVLDSGIKHDHPSFGDAGMPPPPSNWTGRCEPMSWCNNKLIGARSFGSGGTPEDLDGHGTHVASTAAGNFVPGANVYGNANGTAVGIAPRAHVAMYKVCYACPHRDNRTCCPDSDILAGIDAAISDGVDVLSMSISVSRSRPFHSDSIAIGGFSAMERGIFVSVGAGNGGPSPRTIGNEAPWLLTLGASSINRKLTATVALGNNREFDGEALFQPQQFSPNQFPLVYPGLSNTDRDVLFCNSSSLGNYTVRGKIVLCWRGGAGAARNVRNFGGEGMILMNEATRGYTISLQNIRLLPVSQVSFAVGQQIIGYIRASTNPTAALVYKGTVIGDVHAPAVASFSSRGPSVQSPGILKPDIIGPGLNILAASPFSVTFDFKSGTSMACPHLSGVAALLKKAHPNWSPAAIKSAIMTTAYQTNLGNNPIEDETHNPANVFALGAGHVDPSRATNPGLIYDIQPDDYIPYLCGLGYTNRQVLTIVGSSVDCSRITPIKEAQLNYPSFSVRLSASSTQTYTRTVTNVGGANINYSVGVHGPPGVQVVVPHGSLFFSQQNQKLTYQVTFTRLPGTPNGTFQGFITWSSNSHLVRSPIAAVLY